MNTEFTKQLEEYTQAFKKLAHLEQPGFNAISILKFEEQPTSIASFGDSRATSAAMLFSSFVTSIKELDAPMNLPDLILTLVMVLDMEITDDFIHALQNMAIAAKNHTKQ